MAGKHTAGPWVAFEIAPDDPSWGACEIWPASAAAERENDDRTVRPVATMVCGVENARLIAAAPDLLEALIELRGFAARVADGVDAGSVEEYIEQADAAITRATQPLPPTSEVES